MAAASIPFSRAVAATPPGRRPTLALVGNPNTGKTSLFNRLTGVRAKTANFPGTTIERRLGQVDLGGLRAELQDLPGLYGLSATSPEERVAREALQEADAALVVVDATNLARNLSLADEVRALGRPFVVGLNMVDIARREGVSIDTGALAREIGAPVVALSARTGEGLEEIRRALRDLLPGPGRPAAMAPPVVPAAPPCASCSGCSVSARFDWAEAVAGQVSRGVPRLSSERTARIDRVVTHPVAGLVVLAGVMAALFVALFALAEAPMSAIEAGVAAVGLWVGQRLPEGDLRSLVVDGVLGGVGGVLVFLPQIAILFFLLSILEDSGYLARAAVVLDRLMGKVGLPGQAFVPIVSAHACAIPAIMSTRVIADPRDRLATILVLPLMTCSARLPVYAMIAALLFAGRPLLGGLVFAGAYALGIAAALVMAWSFRRTLLPGRARPLLLELPTYKRPSLRNALLAMRDRALVFLGKAGTVILGVSLTLWALATYPKAPAEDLALLEEGARGAYALEHSAAGRLGKWMEPAFRPLGFDWRIDIGLLSSFAARETLVSTLAVVYGLDGEAAEDAGGLRDTLRAQRRPDGRPVYGVPTAVALLVFFVLAMQCLPTQAVTRRETGSWRWAAFQLAYMTALAYGAAFVTYQTLSRLGV